MVGMIMELFSPDIVALIVVAILAVTVLVAAVLVRQKRNEHPGVHLNFNEHKGREKSGR